MMFNVKVCALVIMAVWACVLAFPKPPRNPIYTDPCVGKCEVNITARNSFCGTDGWTYINEGFLTCFQECEIWVTKAYDGPCEPFNQLTQPVKPISSNDISN